MDASRSGCWEVVIDGTLHQNHSIGPLRELIERWRAKQPVTSLIDRWAHLPHLEGLCRCSDPIGCNRCMDPVEEPDDDE